MSEKIEYQIEKDIDSGRIFIAVEGKQIEILINEEGIAIEITSGNEVLAECSVDRE